MGVCRPRRAGPRPLLRLAFRTGAIGAPLEINARSTVIASVSEAIQRNVGPPTISWIAASACRPPRDDDSIRIRLASGMADRAAIDARIAAHGGHSQSAKVIRPTLGVAFALVGVGKSGMNHAHQRAAVPFDEINLDQA